MDVFFSETRCSIKSMPHTVHRIELEKDRFRWSKYIHWIEQHCSFPQNQWILRQQSVSCQRILYMLFIPLAMPRRTSLNKRIHRHVIFILVSSGHGARDYSFCSRYAYTIEPCLTHVAGLHCHIDAFCQGLSSCRINSSWNSKNVI